MKLKQRISSSLRSFTTMEQEKINFDDYDYIDLGYVCRGVKNNQGYSKIFVRIGRESIDKPYTSIRIIEKYYYTFTDTPHHTDDTYYNWTGDLNDYIRQHLKKKKGDNNV